MAMTRCEDNDNNNSNNNKIADSEIARRRDLEKVLVFIHHQSQQLEMNFLTVKSGRLVSQTVQSM
jgi:hypothetical protein